MEILEYEVTKYLLQTDASAGVAVAVEVADILKGKLFSNMTASVVDWFARRALQVTRLRMHFIKTHPAKTPQTSVAANS